LDDKRDLVYICSGIRQMRRERIRSLLHFNLSGNVKGQDFMDISGQVSLISNKVQEILKEENGYFLVEISVRPGNSIKIYVDADKGATIDRLSGINRKLRRWLEEDIYPAGDFSLEVSSPGLDEPLKLDRQYVKNIGRQVDVLQMDGTRKQGCLKEVGDREILLEETRGKGKKKETIQHRISKGNIKATKIHIKV